MRRRREQASAGKPTQATLAFRARQRSVLRAADSGAGTSPSLCGSGGAEAARDAPPLADAPPLVVEQRGANLAVNSGAINLPSMSASPVSYTHLTLPTILLV